MLHAVAVMPQQQQQQQQQQTEPPSDTAKVKRSKWKVVQKARGGAPPASNGFF